MNLFYCKKDLLHSYSSRPLILFHTSQLRQYDDSDIQILELYHTDIFLQGFSCHIHYPRVWVPSSRVLIYVTSICQYSWSPWGISGLFWAEQELLRCQYWKRPPVHLEPQIVELCNLWGSVLLCAKHFSCQRWNAFLETMEEPKTRALTQSALACPFNFDAPAASALTSINHVLEILTS